MMLGTNNIFTTLGIILTLLVVAYVLLWLCILMIRKIAIYSSGSVDTPQIDIAASEIDLHARIAAAAVAVAIEMENETVPHEFPLPPTALVSAWQAVKRADILKRHGGRPR